MTSIAFLSYAAGALTGALLVGVLAVKGIKAAEGRAARAWENYERLCAKYRDLHRRFWERPNV